MKILFLCNKSPWPPKEGGPMAMNMLIEGLLEAGHQVRVLAVNSFKYNVSPDDIPPGYLDKTSIELIDVDLRVRPLHAFLNLFTGKSYHVQRFISGTFRGRLAAVLESGGFDIVQIETLYMCPYIPDIRRHSRAVIVLRAHNIEHLVWERLAGETKNPVKRWYIGHLAKTLKNYEEKAVFECDGIAAITPTDAAYFESAVRSRQSTVRSPQSAVGSRISRIQYPVSRIPHPVSVSSHIPVIDLPYGVDPANYPFDPGTVDFPSLFSLGSMNWRPNAEGIRWFLDNVWPDVHRQFPALKYHLAGRGMPDWMRNLEIPGVVVEGEVPDAASFLASKAIMIVPLFSGSGIRIKIIEGMAAGKTIISTSVGAEGIACTDREDILIADAPCEFFEMISLCTSDRLKSEKIGKAARNLVAGRYLPAAVIRKLLAFYQQLLG